MLGLPMYDHWWLTIELMWVHLILLLHFDSPSSLSLRSFFKFDFIGKYTMLTDFYLFKTLDLIFDLLGLLVFRSEYYL